MKLKIVFLIYLFFYSSMGVADCSGVICTDVSIQSMQVSNTGAVWIKTSGIETGLNCTPNSDVYLWLDGGKPGRNVIYSALLAYKVAGKNLDFRIVESSNPCEVLYINTP